MASTATASRNDLPAGAARAIADAASPPETKSQRFIRLANVRVNKLIRVARHVQNLADRRNYEYSEAQAKKLVAKLSQVFDVLSKAYSGGDVAADEWSL